MPVIGTRGFASGFDGALIWLQASGGRMGGRLGTALAQGQDTAPFYVKQVVTSGLAYLDPTLLDIQGGDKIVASEDFGNSKINPFDLQISVIDADMIAAITGTAVEETQTEFPIFSNNPSASDMPVCGIMLFQRFQPVDTGTDGPRMYHHIVIPRCTIRPKFAGPTYQGNAYMTFRVTPTFTDRMPTGELFSSTDLNLADGKADHYNIISEQRIYWHSRIGDGTATTVTLPYRPYSTEVSPLVDADVFMYRNGVATVLTSAVVATGVLTFAAGSAGSFDVFQTKTAYQLV